VLAAVPAFAPSIVDHILDMRANNELITDVSVVLAGVPESDADSAIARFPEIERAVVLDPEAWTITVRAAIRTTTPVATLEQRIERNGSAIIVVRTKESP
jgi:hypothetical protein